MGVRTVLFILLYIAGAGATVYFFLYLIFSRKTWSNNWMGFQILTFGAVNMLALDNSIRGILFPGFVASLYTSLGVLIILVVAIWWRLVSYVQIRFLRGNHVHEEVLGRHRREMHQDRGADTPDTDSSGDEPIRNGS